MTSDFTPDCDRCAALCCIVHAFDAGPSFAIDKPAGLPCPRLAGHTCTIHARLNDEGFPGCSGYTCQGAGQIVVQEIFEGRTWRDDPRLVGPMAEALRVIREVQDIRSQLDAAGGLALTGAQRAERDALDAALSGPWTADRLATFDPNKARVAFLHFAAGLRPGVASKARAL